MLFYAFASMKAVYGGGWPGIVLRVFAIIVADAVLFALAIAALLVAAVTLR